MMTTTTCASTPGPLIGNRQNAPIYLAQRHTYLSDSHLDYLQCTPCSFVSAVAPRVSELLILLFAQSFQAYKEAFKTIGTERERERVELLVFDILRISGIVSECTSRHYYCCYHRHRRFQWLRENEEEKEEVEEDGGY